MPRSGSIARESLNFVARRREVRRRAPLRPLHPCTQLRRIVEANEAMIARLTTSRPVYLTSKWEADHAAHSARLAQLHRDAACVRDAHMRFPCPSDPFDTCISRVPAAQSAHANPHAPRARVQVRDTHRGRPARARAARSPAGCRRRGARARPPTRRGAAARGGHGRRRAPERAARGCGGRGRG